jgi:hypothetical protein
MQAWTSDDNQVVPAQPCSGRKGLLRRAAILFHVPHVLFVYDRPCLSSIFRCPNSTFPVAGRLMEP